MISSLMLMRIYYHTKMIIFVILDGYNEEDTVIISSNDIIRYESN
ncbi:protein of unknown function [Candidatus Nitrosocaldus cavascurensis]|uniref:Uncharacterized protein n=1 Tax=Candidatus Nitrosocaldus cavascurensis TaxID=2058097 RepID=A0A2K5APV9_9ARCH|nr:protein of unknown function [Candidatus Nitrosocaldus cavascurensis]